MIKTKYEIKFSIDDDEFDIVVREPNAKEKKELDLKSQNAKSILDKMQSLADKETELNSELLSVQNEIEINKEIIANAEIKDKIALLWENKKLNKRIGEIKSEIKNLGDSEKLLKDFEAALEESFKFKTSLLIENSEFIKFINDKAISHKLVWEVLNQKIIKAQEKK